MFMSILDDTAKQELSIRENEFSFSVWAKNFFGETFSNIRYVTLTEQG